MATFPAAGLTGNLLQQAATTKDFRDSGYVQGTAVVKDGNKTKRSVDVNRVSRVLDPASVASSTTLGAAETLAIGSVIQAVPVSKGDIITGAVVKVITAAGGVSLASLGTAGGTNLFASLDLNAAAGTYYTVELAAPIAIAADDTIDFTYLATSAAFAGSFLIELLIVPSPTR